MRNLKLLLLSFFYGEPLAFFTERLWIHYLKTVAKIRDAEGKESPFYLYENLDDDACPECDRIFSLEEGSDEDFSLARDKILA